MSVSNLDLGSDEKAAIVCMFFSRLPSNDERYKGKWTPALRLLAEKYNVKFSTLKQNKDRFDANFDTNDRKGYYQIPLEKAHKFLYEMFFKYKDTPIDEHQQLVEQILDEAKEEGEFYYSIKTKNPASVEAVLNRESNIEIDGLNILKNGLTINQLVFIVFGGDKPAWETGLVGMGIISQTPYDEGYEGKNYKIQIDVKVLLSKPIKRDDLVPYKDTYDIIGIGPITKWEPNQAISQIPEKKAVALMRAMLELRPGIDKELSAVIDDQLMTRVKGTAVKLIPQEVDYGEHVSSENDSDDEEQCKQSDEYAEIYNPDIKSILKNFSLAERPIISLKNFVNSGKHIIMTGPPGTGKTTLAERACEEAVAKNYISNYMMTTATADWSTFDTIGGYMPDNTGKLKFQEGVFLKSIRENKWIVIDEINRAEVDKAFGHFLTVLSGKNIELQFKAETIHGADQNISIKYSASRGSFYDAEKATYNIGRNWRIISTMNTYDKNSLFTLSYAFMRRFSFIYIPTPDEDSFNEIIRDRLNGRDDISEILLELIKRSPRKMGAAIMIDLINYLEESNYEGIVDGICSLVIPQYEGLSLPQIKRLYKDFGELFLDEDKDIFRDYLCEFFDINQSELAKVKFAEDPNEAEDDE